MYIFLLGKENGKEKREKIEGKEEDTYCFFFLLRFFLSFFLLFSSLLLTHTHTHTKSLPPHKVSFTSLTTKFLLSNPILFYNTQPGPPPVGGWRCGLVWFGLVLLMEMVRGGGGMLRVRG